MSAVKINVIKPSVNNMTARVFMRAAGLDFTEHDVYGQTRSADYRARCPSRLTPMIESENLPEGALWESCAIMQYLCNKHVRIYRGAHFGRAARSCSISATSTVSRSFIRLMPSGAR